MSRPHVVAYVPLVDPLPRSPVAPVAPVAPDGPIHHINKLEEAPLLQRNHETRLSVDVPTVCCKFHCLSLKRSPKFVTGDYVHDVY